MKPAKAKPSQHRHLEASRAPGAEDARSPLRQCMATHERYPKEVMIRFVAGPDGAVVPDLKAALPGRGAWVVADAKAVGTAIRKKLFARALDGPVTAQADLAEKVGALLTRRCLDLLGQAQGAGALLLGSGAVQSAARQGEVAVLIEASDGAPDGRRKALASLKAGGRLMAHGPEKATIVGCFTSAELSLALGRENVIHAALPDGGFATRFLADARRLEGFRELIPKAWAEDKGSATKGSDE